MTTANTTTTTTVTLQDGIPYIAALEWRTDGHGQMLVPCDCWIEIAGMQPRFYKEGEQTDVGSPVYHALKDSGLASDPDRVMRGLADKARTAHEAMVALGMDPQGAPWHAQNELGKEIIRMAMGHDLDAPATTVADSLLTRLMRRSARVQALLVETQQHKAEKTEIRAEERKQRELAQSLAGLLETRATAQNATIKNYKERLEGLLAEVERLDPLQKTVREQAAELAELRPLAAKEQARLAASSARRSKAAKAAAKKRAAATAAARKAKLQERYESLLSAALGSGEVPRAVHRAIAKRLGNGVTAAYDIVWALDSKLAPKEVYRSAYYATAGGTVVRSPNRYPGRCYYHHAVRSIHIGKAWYKRNLKSLCREAAAL